MKKIIILAVIALIFIAGGAGAMLVFTKGSNPSPSSNASASGSFAIVKACDILTPAVAKSLLGDQIQQVPSPADQSNNGVSQNVCSYRTKPSTGAQNSNQPTTSVATLIAENPTTDTGKNNIQAVFSTPDSKNQVVQNIGDKAFYTPTFRQLYVLKGSRMYIVSYYNGAITNGSADSDKQLAQMLPLK